VTVHPDGRWPTTPEIAAAGGVGTLAAAFVERMRENRPGLAADRPLSPDMRELVGARLRDLPLARRS
jgi:hypothetical protein